MNPEEKAVELVNSFSKITDRGGAKMCAQVALDEIINFMDRFDLDLEMRHQFDWWREVKRVLMEPNF